MFFTPFHAEHIDALAPHGDEAAKLFGIKARDVGATLAAGTSLTAWHAGRCVAAGGLIDHWPGRAELWALFAPTASRLMIPIARKVAAVLACESRRRVEYVTSSNNFSAIRLAAALGFKHESLLKAYMPDGTDAIMFVKVNA